MSFRRKCKICGEYIINEAEAMEYKNGYIHSRCFSISIKLAQEERLKKSVTNKKRKEKNDIQTKAVKIPQKGLSEEQYQEKVAYYDYVKKLIGTEHLPAKIYAISEKYKEKYNFTFEGMSKTLLYCFEYQDKELGEDCVKLLPHYYDEAMNCFSQMKEKRRNFSSSIDLIGQSKEVTIKIGLQRKRKNKLFDINEIGEKTYE